MGMFQALFGKKAKVTFEKVKDETTVLENQERRVENPTKADLEEFLDGLFEDEDQFITFTLEKAVNGVRFVQACFVGSKIIIQLGLEEGENTHLVERSDFNAQECINIFHKFYDYRILDNIDEYEPVEME